MSLELPAFGVEQYRSLLGRLRDTGADLLPVSAMPDGGPGRRVYLRHDIDLHIDGVDRFARAEAEQGAVATYFVLITQHYNPLYPPNARMLRELAEMGHEIGLHYDLMTYPEGEDEALDHLRWELDVLGGVIGFPVRCISMHQPYKGRPDIFRELDGYVHPHNPAYGTNLVYVSDSCRAWRDESLLGFLSADDPDGRLLLLTHPESWFEPELTDRIAYLEQVVLPNATRQSRRFVEETVRGVWESHPGAALHDLREATRSLSSDLTGSAQ